MTETPDDREPPRLQDTSEREALSVPLPGSEGGEPAPAEEPTAESPAPVEEPPAEPAPEPVEDPEPPAEPGPAPVEEPPPAAAGNGGAAGHEGAVPPFEPAPSVAGFSRDDGPPIELLMGAAFVGGLALAILIRRRRG